MTVAAPDLNLSAHDNEELVAAIALLEDRLALRKIAGWNSGSQEMMETAFCFRHFAIPMRRPDAHSFSPYPDAIRQSLQIFGISPRENIPPTSERAVGSISAMSPLARQ